MSDGPREVGPSPVDLAERATLGAILISSDALVEVADVLDGPEFRNAGHETIYQAVAQLAAEGRPHDALAVAMRLEQTGDLTRVGGQAYLHDLVACVVTATSGEWYARQVWEASMKRRVRAVGARLEGVSERDGAALEILDAARAELDAAMEARDGEVPMSDSVDAAIASLDEPPGLDTPWPSMTRALGGWRPESLYVVAARPAVGKSVFGMACALDAARRGHTAVVFSLEMSRAELILRLASNIGEVDGQRISHRALRPEDRRKLAAAAEHLKGLPLIIDDRANLSVAQVRSKVRRIQRRHDVGLVVVDYLGKLKAPSDAPKNDRRVQVDAIVWGLKETARTLRVPLLSLAQLNRGSAARSTDSDGWHSLQVSDLRESGGIEADADVVGLLDRKEGDQGCDMRVSWEKNRHGPQTYNDFIFQGRYSRICDDSSWGERGAQHDGVAGQSAAPAPTNVSPLWGRKDKT